MWNNWYEKVRFENVIIKFVPLILLSLLTGEFIATLITALVFAVLVAKFGQGTGD